ncbi:secretin N-terminal domain-containing protein [Pantanalinema rosaneae CENA516]|uniref:secretin N-terminal domain-containing protein n=1 Tax=Pantanalinema rosaneae TaxID=1620701 RepID=UPI003D6EC151
MQQTQGLTGILIGGVMLGAATLITPPPAVAAKTSDVQLKATASGVNVLLTTPGKGKAPAQVVAASQGNRLTADVMSSDIQLPSGGIWRNNPAPGIAKITVAPLSQDRVRVTVIGKTDAPIAKIDRLAGSISLQTAAAKPGQRSSTVNKGAIAQQTAPARSSSPAFIPGFGRVPPNVRVVEKSKDAEAGMIPAPVAQVPPVVSPMQGPPPLIPNPDVRVQGPAPVPGVPLSPRAVPPPVGDISTASIDTAPTLVDLGTAQTVPRLVLRDAPAREVLALLARAAGLNLVFTGEQEGTQQQPGQPGAATPEGPRITLDLENVPVQNAFNYVLMVSGLEANRRGNTIFVGTRLPNTARDVLIRSVRLNQVPVVNALNYLVSLGAESVISRERLVTSVNAVPVTQLAGAAQSAITQTQTTTEQRLETQRVDFTDSVPFLRGMQVSGDERTNMLTMVGSPRQIEIALSQLTQLDVRRRQVAVNVRVIDVNLLALDRAYSSFSFGVEDTRVVSEGGVGVINFGKVTPANTGLSGASVGQGVVGLTSFSQFPFNFVRNFFAQLQFAITNGNAKVVTDPTLVIQEGQRAEVRLTQEVVTNFEQQVTATENSTQITITVEKASAGLILPIQVDRIDDNGFISMSVAPTIAAPASTQDISIPGSGGSAASVNTITLLSERRLQSGQVRMRDGQTLVLAGVIQDQDRAAVTKIPILGDIPILGALFRRTERQNQRQELIVLVTPRVLDDSERSTFGYSYTPGPGVQRVLEQGAQQPR